MTPRAAIDRMIAVIRLRHYAFSTERTYVEWARRYVDFLLARRPAGTSEEKFAAYLTHLARDCDVSAVTQNQAFNALRFFYAHGIVQPLGDVQALRARRRVHERMAPSVAQVRALRAAVVDTPHTPARLLVDLLYGCGLRVSEPLELRVRDILWTESQLIIRDAKGAKDRRVPLPCSLVAPLRAQLERARLAWQWDRTHHPAVGVALPHRLGKKYPAMPFAWTWFWVFPAPGHCTHPRTGQRVRYHLLDVALQRAVKTAAVATGLHGIVTPHCLRHAYATHQLSRGESVKTIQVVMGHVSLETTAGYLHAEVGRASNPLDALLV
jgi:integron integrase